MRAVIQRVSRASVEIHSRNHASIAKGMLILVAIHQHDEETDLHWMVKKISTLRIFADEQNKMNLSLSQVGGELLVVSQFTLYADVKHGNRPSFIQSASPEKAKTLYHQFIELLKNQMPTTKLRTGIFAEDMEVHLVNDGPVTIILDSQS